MSKTIAVLLLASAVLAVLPAAAEEAPAAPAKAAPAIETEEQKTLYALGVWLSNRVAQLNLRESELPYVEAGLADGVAGREKKVDLKVYGPKIDELAKSRSEAAAGPEKRAGAAFAEKMAAEPGAVKKPSGLVYIEAQAGTGESPKATDKVRVHYHGTLIDGSVFDSSVNRGKPSEFALNQVIPCWTEGLQLMKVGGKAKLICPSDIAYGDAGNARIKPGATLIFDVELLEILK